MSFNPDFVAYADTAQQLTQVLLNGVFKQRGERPITATQAILLQDVARAVSSALNYPENAEAHWKKVAEVSLLLAQYTEAFRSTTQSPVEGKTDAGSDFPD